jgi:diguanylate cyclase (GGDEF)-like protein/PAS domain S-box-containing protein
MESDRGRRAVADARPEDVQQALCVYASEFLLAVSADGEVVSSSQDDVLGYSLDRLGSHVGEFLHPDDLPNLFAVIERARTIVGYRDRLRIRAKHADGSWRLLDVAIFLVNDETDRVLFGRAVLRVRDVTDEASWTPAGPGGEDPREGEDRFLCLAEGLPLGILSADARSRVVFCNEAAQQLFNLPTEHLIGHGWERLVHPEDRPEVLGASQELLRTGLPQQVMFRIETGLFVRWASARFVPLGSSASVTGWIATIDDVTDRRRAESELTHQATHDALTGLPNRMLLEDRLQQACARLHDTSGAVSVIFIDLNGFKAVNDTYGHTVGDQVLVEVAGRLRQVVRKVDTVARLGGDEFVAFCEALAEAEVREVVQRIHDAIGIPLMIAGEAVRIGASVGVEATRDPKATFDDLLARADQAMYREKRLNARS